MLLPDAHHLPTLEAQRLRLRHVAQTDAANLFTVFSNPQVMRYWSHGPFANQSEAHAYIESINRCFSARSLFQWVLERHSDRRVIGTCTLAHLDEQNGKAELGFALAHDTWGQGLAYEATSRAIDFAFDELRLRRLEADVDPRNERSMAMLRKLSFTVEGHLRERWLVAGETQDSALLGLLAREWRSRR
jgi:RimJ/RimL family protein N-acetyltransferase